MTEKTYDVENSKDLPYRFSYSPVTDEVYVISLSFHGLGVSMVFENHFAFYRFLIEGMKLNDTIADKVIQQSQEILKAKQES